MRVWEQPATYDAQASDTQYYEAGEAANLSPSSYAASSRMLFHEAILARMM